MYRRTIATLIIASLAAGCASVPRDYRPIIDPKFGDMAAYESNLSDCKSFAGQIDAGNSAAAGAIAGAVVGVALGALFGLRGRNLTQLGVAGAAIHGTRSAEYAGMTQVQIVQRCMIGRGYQVLG
jgi:hypothetical protein